jgi:thiosulfate reductase cytochrome b subunit
MNRMKMDKRLIRKIIHWGLLVIIIIFIITGLGIARYRIIESITLGLLSKPLSYQIHNYLVFPLVIFLYLHVFFIWKKKKKRD